MMILREKRKPKTDLLVSCNVLKNKATKEFKNKSPKIHTINERVTRSKTSPKSPKATLVTRSTTETDNHQTPKKRNNKDLKKEIKIESSKLKTKHLTRANTSQLQVTKSAANKVSHNAQSKVRNNKLRNISDKVRKEVLKSKVSKSPNSNIKIKSTRAKSITRKSLGSSSQTNINNEEGFNKITNYFKKDNTTKHELSLSQSLTSDKKPIWRNASRILPTPSEDPYEFVDDLPKPKKAKRKIYKSTKSRKSKISCKSNGSIRQETTDLQLPKESSNNDVSPVTLVDEISSTSNINVNAENTNVNAENTLEPTHDEEEQIEITPEKNEQTTEINKVFKTPALPLRDTKNQLNFFSNVGAKSTPKINSVVLKNTVSNCNFPKTTSASTPRPSNNDNLLPENQNLKGIFQNVQVSPINENKPSTSSEESDNFDCSIVNQKDELEISSDNEDDCILSGSFVEPKKSVYDKEAMNRSSTPDNFEMMDFSVSLNKSMKNISELENDSSYCQPYSLYGSPLGLSPIKYCSSEKEIELNSSPIKTAFKRSLNYSYLKNVENVKPPRKKKKAETEEDPEYEKWLKDITTEIEEAENVELIVE